MKERRLGRGLEYLVGGSMTTEAPATEALHASPEQPRTPQATIDIAMITPNRYQPRQRFDDEDLRSLADSIKTNGLLQPIVLRKSDVGYEIIAGERRWRASKLAGMTEIPAIVLNKEQDDLLRLALVENIQRKDLNPIEKARGFKALIDKVGITQDEASQILGLNRSTIANFIRLLDLPPVIIDAVSRETISMGHARALLAISNPGEQMQLLKRILDEDLSVRDVERAIAAKSLAKSAAQSDAPDPYIVDLQERLSSHLGTKAYLRKKKRGGTLTIEYYTNDQLTGLFRKMGFHA